MTNKSFSKTLSANDVGKTGAHQAGILVPKGDQELLAFFPCLDVGVKNPDAWIYCTDETGIQRRFRFVYYNNKLHDEKGTRNEYRLTYMTAYLKEMRAQEGDALEFSRTDGASSYSIRLVKKQEAVAELRDGPVRIKITAGWRRVH
jgi:hypothetical protein